MNKNIRGQILIRKITSLLNVLQQNTQNRAFIT